MEIALHPAPDLQRRSWNPGAEVLRAAADHALPMVAVTLLHREGHFYQTLDRSDQLR
jgi:hypothetical protein